MLTGRSGFIFGFNSLYSKIKIVIRKCSELTFTVLGGGEYKNFFVGSLVSRSLLLFTMDKFMI